jgi:hypothetical protein
LEIAGSGPLMPISETLFAPYGPVGSYDGTRIVTISGRSRMEKIL